jgi:hypothetical protein
VEEERDLTNAYRTTKRAPAPQGQGLNDLYIRYFHMAERRIVEKSGEGIISFSSNCSWLDGLSFTGMREKYLEVFDSITEDCLNGDKFKTGKLTPEGKPDSSVFSTEANRKGIQVGTAIATLVKRGGRGGAPSLPFRGKCRDARLFRATNFNRWSNHRIDSVETGGRFWFNARTNLWDANGYMPNDWSPASKRAGRPENWSAKFPWPPKWAALIPR